METDAAGRVSAMTDASGAVTRFEYDAQGNRKAAVRVIGVLEPRPLAREATDDP